MLDDEEAVEQLESHGRYREEVEGRDYLAVVLEESEPPPARVAPAVDTP